jgi:amino acid transporter
VTVLDAAVAERGKLRRVLGRMDTVFFLISAMVVVDTIGAIAVGGGETFTWLVVLFVTFFVPSALASAELGAAIPEEGGAYVWVRRAFGRYAGALTSLLYWAGTPMWLGGSVAVVAMAATSSSRAACRWPTCTCSSRVRGCGHGRCDPPAAAGRDSCHGAVGQIVLLTFFTLSVALRRPQ